MASPSFLPKVAYAQMDTLRTLTLGPTTTPSHLESERLDLYEPLVSSLEKPYPIRLLDLLPGSSKEQIQCRLRIVALAETGSDSHPLYEALSYVWGDASRKVEITVNEFQLAITTNLEIALQHLRHESTLRTLWIDAICIDQSNLEERSEQVLRMKSLYENASSVLMWLGPATTDDEAALSALRDMGKHLHEWEQRGLEKIADPVPPPREKYCRLCPLQDVDSATWARIGAIFTARAYWERRWIVQEVLLAKEATIICGHTAIPISMLAGLQSHVFEELTQVASKLHATTMDELLGIWSLVDARNRLQKRNVRRLGMPILLDQFEHCKCEDDRDIFYALLGISDLEGRLLPDYSKSVGEIYVEATVAMMMRANDLRGLSNVNRRKVSKLSIEEKPSWVPDWSIPAISSPLSDPHEVNTLKPPPEVMSSEHTTLPANTLDPAQPRLLKLQGHLLDTVTAVITPRARLSRHTTTPADVQARILSLEPSFFFHQKYPTGEYALNVFWRTVLRYHSATHTHPFDYEETVLESTDGLMEYGWQIYHRQNRFRGMGTAGRKRSWVMDEDFLSAISDTLDSWHMGLTNAGYCALVPRSTLKNDVVAIADSCVFPIVLRGKLGDNIEDENTKFELVGGSYVHGISEEKASDADRDIEALKKAFPEASEKRVIILR